MNRRTRFRGDCAPRALPRLDQHGLEQEFNYTLDNQWEASEASIKS